MANLEHDIPLTENSVFRIASVSKQFTAMAVLLAEEGLIDLDEDIRTYLPDLLDHGHKVTIKAMLGHYSGWGITTLLQLVMVDWQAFAHSGGWLGSSTYYIRFPEDNFSIIALCNNTNQTPYTYVLKVAETFFEQE